MEWIEHFVHGMRVYSSIMEQFICTSVYVCYCYVRTLVRHTMQYNVMCALPMHYLIHCNVILN